MEDLFKTYKRNVALGINIDNLYYIYDRSSNNILEVSKYIYENLDYLSLFESSIENIFGNYIQSYSITLVKPCNF